MWSMNLVNTTFCTHLLLVNGNEHTVHFLKKQPQVHSINYIGKISTITIGGFEFPLPTIKKKYDILIVGDMHIPVEVT